MKKYIAKRVIYMLITMLIITAATFFLMHSIPGDPLSYMARNLPEPVSYTHLTLPTICSV